MKSVLRSLGAVLAGFITASLLMTLVECLNGRVLYPGLAKAAEGLKDREAIRAVFASAPMGALFVVIFGWALGSFVGGWVAAKLGKPAGMRSALILGALLTLLGITNNLMLPPPMWFWAASLAMLLPGAYLGARVAAR
jgi:hypothetical protein